MATAEREPITGGLQGLGSGAKPPEAEMASEQKVGLIFRISHFAVMFLLLFTQAKLKDQE